MEKFLTLLVPAFLLSAPVHAQVAIGLNEMPAAADELRLTQANLNLFINYAQTGPGFTWNYTNLQMYWQNPRFMEATRIIIKRNYSG